jgi:hypothetical protein
VDTGRLYTRGHVDSQACGIGFGFGSYYPSETVIVFPPGSAMPDIQDMDYLFVSTGAVAAVNIGRATQENWETGSGGGEFTFVATGGDCIRTGYERFEFSGAIEIFF